MADWINILINIFLTGGIFLYLLQEHDKKRDAASLIISQIDELKERLREIQGYIVDGKLNDTNFYESLPIMDMNYWAMYRHYFVRKMDTVSYDNINKFYDYVSKIKDQQMFVKHFQERNFEKTHDVLVNIETQLILKNFFIQDYNYFWNIYRMEEDKLKNIINQNVPMLYIPKQIRLTLENMLKGCSMLEIAGTDGYRMLKRISKRKK